LIDPAHPSPLVTLMGDVVNAVAYARGVEKDKGKVGLSAAGDDVVVRLNRPATDFATSVSGPTFAIVPATVDAPQGLSAGDGFVGSGGYVLSAATDKESNLEANCQLLVARPAIRK